MAETESIWERIAGGLTALPDRVLALLDNMLDHCPRRLGDMPMAALLTAPALLILGAFSFAPMVNSFLLSLHGGKRGGGDFVGLGNYLEAARSGDFWRSLAVTVYYVLGTIPAMLAFSLVIALALHRVGRARGLFRTLYFLPYVTSVVAAATVWRSLFNPRGGVFNLLLAWAGAGPQQWLLEPRGVLHLLTGGAVDPSIGPSLALCCIMLFDIWHGCGFMVVVFLAGLSSIPREIEESARIDGAGGLRTTWHITLPLLSPTIFFLAVVGVVRAFQAFNSFYALTQGGGNTQDTRNLILYIYSQFYDYGYWGYATAASTLLTLAIVTLTAVQWRFAGRRVHYS
jgi:multiple sugar transport system permease protein